MLRVVLDEHRGRLWYVMKTYTRISNVVWIAYFGLAAEYDVEIQFNHDHNPNPVLRSELLTYTS